MSLKSLFLQFIPSKKISSIEELQSILNEGISRIEDSEQFAELIFNEYQHKLKRSFFAAVRNEEIAEDLTLEVLYKVISKIDSYQANKSKFNTWVWNIYQNHLIDYFRKSKNQIDLITSESIDIDKLEFDQNQEFLLDSELEKMISKENLKLVDMAISKLSPFNQQIILLWLDDELTLKEIASIMKTNEQNIKNRIFQAKLKLKEYLYGKI